MKKEKEKIKVIVADYWAKNKKSLLERCEKIRSEYDGFLHAGIIHYVQSKMPYFTLKAAIARVLDKCPEVWPENLPELVEAGKEPEITEVMKKEFKELNESLIIPIQGPDIVEIIRLAKEFLQLYGKKKRKKHYEKQKTKLGKRKKTVN